MGVHDDGVPKPDPIKETLARINVLLSDAGESLHLASKNYDVPSQVALSLQSIAASLLAVAELTYQVAREELDE